jgi:very-short-patch-repair endonuclease
MSIATERSADHRWAEVQLDNAVISYDSEHRFGKYVVDIYLPEWHIGIELDGPTHSPAKDILRNEELEGRYGLALWHINTVRHKRDRSTLTWRAYWPLGLRVFIEANAETTEKRMALWRKNSATS